MKPPRWPKWTLAEWLALGFVLTALFLPWTAAELSRPPVIEPRLRDRLEQAAGTDHLSKQTLAGVTHLELTELGVSHVDGLELCTNLRSLTLDCSYNDGCTTWYRLRNIDALAELKKLETLDISGNGLTSIGPLAGLSRLETLNADFNPIESIIPCMQMPNLRTLSMKDNSLLVIRSFGSTTKLQTLDLSGSTLQLVMGLDQLKELEELDLSSTEITTLEGLGELPKLKVLRIGYTPLASLDAIDFPASLKILDIGTNQYSAEQLKQVRSRGIMIETRQ